MECGKTKKILSLVLLIAAVLVYFLTEWTIWIPIALLVLAIVRFFCKCKCKVCSPKGEVAPETPVKEKSEEAEEVKEKSEEAEKVEEAPVEEVSEETEEEKE